MVVMLTEVHSCSQNFLVVDLVEGNPHHSVRNTGKQVLPVKSGKTYIKYTRNIEEIKRKQ